jgi:ABC-2 type transport system permease protein
VRGLVGWSLGVVVLILTVAAVFPSVEGSAELSDLVESYPESFKALFGLSGGADISTGPGFIDAELFSFMLPLLLLVLGIGAGARTLAGEEDAGRLELLFAYPLRRRSAVLAKGLGVGVEVTILCAVTFAGLALADPVFGLDLPLGRLAAGVAGIGVLALLHGWLALAVGAWRPSRALAIGVPAALAAAAYLVSGLHELASWLDPLRYLSSFWWIGPTPLTDGVSLGGFLLVSASAALALGAAALLIERRDLQTP